MAEREITVLFGIIGLVLILETVAYLIGELTLVIIMAAAVHLIVKRIEMNRAAHPARVETNHDHRR